MAGTGVVGATVGCGDVVDVGGPTYGVFTANATGGFPSSDYEIVYGQVGESRTTVHDCSSGGSQRGFHERPEGCSAAGSDADRANRPTATVEPTHDS